jgi:nucleotide sugar dehydrogenase
MKLVIIGTGYVGLVTGTCFAEMGNQVICIDIDQLKLRQLRAGNIPIHEPGLTDMVERNVSAGRLLFSDNLSASLLDAEIVFIAVGTPSNEDGSADLAYVLNAASEIGENLTHPIVVVDKSTVPVGTADKVRATIRRELDVRKQNVEFDVVSNPEFLREGSAVSDFMYPDRIVIGSENPKSQRTMNELYGSFSKKQERIQFVGVRDAEMIKYAANAMLATKISFMNEIALMCDEMDIDIENVRRGIGSDPRIGSAFIYPGCGYGGSCFPKDVRAMINMAENAGLETVLEYILIMDGQLTIKQANRAYYSTFGAEPSEVIGKLRRERVTKGNRELFDSLLARLFEKKKPMQFSAFANGFDLNFEITLVPLMNGDGEVVGVVEVGRNVTEQRKLEEQLRQSQKMDAVGQLAGGVAHDFNNFLQIILGYAENLRQEQEEAGKSVTSTEQILNAGTKAAALTQQLLAFSRQQVMQPQVVEIDEVVDTTLDLVTRLIQSNVVIEVAKLASGTKVEVDANLIEQVLINLCLNARDAMPDGGTLTLAVNLMDQAHLPEGLATNDQGYVCVSVKDTGHGIAPENQERIFEPFFSTKDINKGTGLGLATAYGIIEQHHGAIKVVSAEGEGATFSVYLPITERSQVTETSTSEKSSELAGGETILVAEDDKSIRDLLTFMLRSAGYDVITATNGAEALETFEAKKDQIQLLLIDVMMPELSGDKVIAKVRELESDMPCLIASGYSEDQGLERLVGEPHTRFINKPFKMAVLLSEVRGLLEGQVVEEE